jgi:hypothetical protein
MACRPDLVDPGPRVGEGSVARQEGTLQAGADGAVISLASSRIRGYSRPHLSLGCPPGSWAKKIRGACATRAAAQHMPHQGSHPAALRTRCLLKPGFLVGRERVVCRLSGLTSVDDAGRSAGRQRTRTSSFVARCNLGPSAARGPAQAAQRVAMLQAVGSERRPLKPGGGEGSNDDDFIAVLQVGAPRPPLPNGQFSSAGCAPAPVDAHARLHAATRAVGCS